MAFLFEDFSYLAEQNPAQYYELLNAMKQIETKLEMEAQFAQNMAKYADYEILPNAAGHTFINTGTRIAGEYVGPVSSSTETALELATEAYDYEVLGADGQVLYRANMGGLKTAGTGGAPDVYETTPLLSMDLGAVGAAVAPLFGVALGADLYTKSPEFWTMLSQKLLPFCYPGTTEIPAWLDIVDSAVDPGTLLGHIILDKQIVDSLSDFFLEYFPEFPEYVDTGSVRITEIASLDDVMSEIIKYPPNGILIDDDVISEFRSAIAQHPNNPFIIRVDTGTGALVGQSPLTLYIIKDIEVGNIVTLGTYPYAWEYRTWGVKSAGGILHVSTTGGNPFNTSTGIFEGIKSVSETTSVSSLNATPAKPMPEGVSKWGGNSAALNEYTKSIIHMVEDPNNPGHFVVDSSPGIQIAVPEKTNQPGSAIQSTKPAGWPSDVDWPMTIDFPWSRPDGYEGDWPETTTWPLPQQKPDYWPSVLRYPNRFSMPNISNDPDDEPNPNENATPEKGSKYIDNSQPGTKIDPAEDAEPDPGSDPSDPTPPVTTQIIPADPPGGTPGTPAPPPDSGETPVPVTPIIDIPFTSANDGLISVYHPTDAQLKAFASWLWVTYADPSIDKLWNNPFDGVIGLMELYCTPTDIGAKNIRSGFLDSGISSQTISRYTEIDCGSIYVPEFYRNYLDYSPYSKAHVYLPFIGIVELNVDDVVGHGINITYKIDEYNGACIAIITCARHVEVDGEDVDYSAVTYQYSGNCAVELPLAGGTQSAIRAGLIQAAAYGLSSVIGGIVSGVSGNIGGAISQVGYGAANAIGSVVSAKSSVQHSGSFGSSYGALGAKTPFIIVSRPKQLRVLNYPRIYGYPAHSAVTIGNCTGYLRVREVHVKSSTATDGEKKRIEELLKEGVYVTE